MSTILAEIKEGENMHNLHWNWSAWTFKGYKFYLKNPY